PNQPFPRPMSRPAVRIQSSALRDLLRSSKPVVGLTRTAAKKSRNEPWDFEFRISSFSRISDLVSAAGRPDPLTPSIFARHAESNKLPFLGFEIRILSSLRISDFVFGI